MIKYDATVETEMIAHLMVYLQEIMRIQPSCEIVEPLFNGKSIICNFKDKERLINKRVDLVSKCRHENKFILLNYSGVD